MATIIVVMKSEKFATVGIFGQCEVWAYHSSTDGDAGSREWQADGRNALLTSSG
jgi:hypothetical protein